MKKRFTWKRALILLPVLAAVVFGGLNLVWYGFKYLPYKRMAGKMQLDGNFQMPRYVYTDETYLFRLKMPGYLSFESGFLYVGPKDENAAVFVPDAQGGLREKNIPHVDAFIWPQPFSEPQYGVTIYEKTYSVQYMMNGAGELLPDSSMSEAERAEASALFERHRDEILDVLRAASGMWGVHFS